MPERENKRSFLRLILGTPRMVVLAVALLLAVGLGLMGTFRGLAAPAADVNGTVALDQAWYRPGSQALITVTDADELTISERRRIARRRELSREDG